ncbi:hypothetical protein HYQ46_008483 [Verticillium longisporum]|nr:hypothetical protein HYQ46_008483 [Verticillium longisporum]
MATRDNAIGRRSCVRLAGVDSTEATDLPLTEALGDSSIRWCSRSRALIFATPFHVRGVQNVRRNSLRGGDVLVGECGGDVWLLSGGRRLLVSARWIRPPLFREFGIDFEATATLSRH